MYAVHIHDTITQFRGRLEIHNDTCNFSLSRPSHFSICCVAASWGFGFAGREEINWVHLGQA